MFATMRVLLPSAVLLFLAAGAASKPTTGTYTEITSFAVPKSPSGLHYYGGLLWVLCGTDTNGEHYLYGYTTAGVQKCFITIPYAEGMTRVDGFYLTGSKAFIVDSQGPLYASFPGRLGGSVYEVDWTNPCGCSEDGSSCSTPTVTWMPTVLKMYVISATDPKIMDGGGNDDTFRNSGIVVKDGAFYAVNGMHPLPTLTCCYPKSLVKVDMATSNVTQKWSFTPSVLGHDTDMEGLTCGPDGCSEYIYVGDEYQYIYKLELDIASPKAAIKVVWNIAAAVGDVPPDKGIEALTYVPDTGYFYAGIQQTAMIHVVQLHDPTPSTSGAAATAAPDATGNAVRVALQPVEEAPQPCSLELTAPATSAAAADAAEGLARLSTSSSIMLRYELATVLGLLLSIARIL